MLVFIGCLILTVHYDRPRNKEELYNLRHASARNVIERIFGVVKKRFKILRDPPSYDLQTQVEIMPALAALHNFIRIHDPEEIDDLLADSFQEPDLNSFGHLADGVTNSAIREAANVRRDLIAQQMWDDYVLELAARGLTTLN